MPTLLLEQAEVQNDVTLIVRSNAYLRSAKVKDGELELLAKDVGKL